MAQDEESGRYICLLSAFVCLLVVPASAAAETITIREVFGPALSEGAGVKAPFVQFGLSVEGGKVECLGSSMEGRVINNESSAPQIVISSLVLDGTEGPCSTSTTLGEHVEASPLDLPWVFTLEEAGSGSMIGAGSGAMGGWAFGNPVELAVSVNTSPTGGPMFCPGHFEIAPDPMGFVGEVMTTACEALEITSP